MNIEDVKPGMLVSYTRDGSKFLIVTVLAGTIHAHMVSGWNSSIFSENHPVWVRLKEECAADFEPDLDHDGTRAMIEATLPEDWHINYDPSGYRIDVFTDNAPPEVQDAHGFPERKDALVAALELAQKVSA